MIWFTLLPRAVISCVSSRRSSGKACRNRLNWTSNGNKNVIVDILGSLDSEYLWFQRLEKAS